jgi:addiction module HigA family antidote
MPIRDLPQSLLTCSEMPVGVFFTGFIFFCPVLCYKTKKTSPRLHTGTKYFYLCGPPTSYLSKNLTHMPRKLSTDHPGQILDTRYIKAHQLTITEVANALGIARKNLYAVIKGDYAISVDMAFKLSKAFDTTPEYWLKAQLNYDLAKGYQTGRKLKVKRLIKR